MGKSERGRKVTTRTGDDGYTGRLGPGRVPKYDPRVEACGDVDEATSALGVARAALADASLKQTILDVQRDLYRLMAELAATPDAAAKLPRRIDAADVSRLEALQSELQALVEVPREFIVPGNSPEGAALDLARTVVRRSERRIARLLHEGLIANGELLRYVNRLSDLLFVAARYVERAEPGGSATVKPD